MAKVTNTFIKSKLNKDLDARLVPNGEYRDAVNVQVSRSEGDSVGSLENVLGNYNDMDFPSGTKCIGHKANEGTGMVYLFFTNYTDASSNNRSYSQSASNYIYEYNVSNNTKTLLVQGAFLNFSTTNPIYGINIIEDLLFWTDNRNQPRKINITLARPTLASGVPSYYTKEDQISVAKYNPFAAIDLYEELSFNQATGASVAETTMKDVISKFYPNGGSAISAATISSGANSFTTSSILGDIQTSSPLNPYAATGSTVSYIDSTGSIVAISGATVTTASYDSGTGVTTITITGATFPALSTGTEIIFNANEYYDKNFAGDPDYLEDKFARFSYRFKFDDGEYSLIAPFTQIAFIPKQDGYFMYVKKDGINTVEDQSNAFRSTVVSFVENKVNQLKLMIPQPSGLTLGQSIYDELKIVELDIIYKEADALALKVIESIEIDDLTSNSTYASWEYIYKSQKPSKVLPDDEITRVYDKTPVRAFAQESSGNRIIYGNFQNKHTPPATIDYDVSATVKTALDLKSGAATVSQNYSPGTNNFNVNLGSGFIGVGSTIVGTNITPGTVVTQITGAGTIPDPYTNVAFSPVSTGAITSGTAYSFVGTASDDKTSSILEYPNSSLKQNRNYQVGIVLSDRYGRQSSVILSDKPSTVYLPYNTSGVSPDSWPGDSLKVRFNSQVGITNPDANTNYPGLYNGDSTSPAYNPLGWYSYKIVVKQTEQEYYNVYLPGIMASYPERHTLELGNTSHTVLINDNINKIPRDLAEVGPDQKQFRSSVQIYGRVENSSNVITYSSLDPTNIGESNNQYYPGNQADTSTMISTMSDMFEYDPLKPAKPNYFPQFYDYDSNPLIARISTQSQIGQIATTNYNTASASVAANVSNSASISLTGISGSTIVANMVVTGPGIPINTYVISFTGGNNPSVTISQDVELQKFDELVFVQGFPSPNRGTVIRPGLEYLAVYETEPVESLIDIYWETTSSGLISDLNNTINTSTEGATQIENFNTSSWSEALADGGNISTAFNLADSLGSDITLSGNDTFTLEYVYNDNGINVNAGSSPYFELIPVATNQTFNIKILTEYFNQIFYSNDAAIRNFIFGFKAVIGGVTSYFTKTGGPSNVAVTLSIDSGFPANGGTLYLNRYNTSSIGVFSGINGSANTSTLINLRTRDLQYSITNQKIVGDTIDRQTPYFALNASVDSLQNVLKATMINSIAASNTGAKHYTITTQLSDAGSSTTHQFFLDLSVNPSSVKIYTNSRYPILNTTNYTGFYTMMLIEIGANSPTGTQGFYVINFIGNGVKIGAELNTGYDSLNTLSTFAGGGDDFTPISIDRLNAATTSTAGVNEDTYFASTEAAAVALWEGSFTSPTTSPGSNTIENITTDAVKLTWEVIYN